MITSLPLERQLELHHQFVEAVLHVVWVSRPDGSVVYLNRLGREFLGRNVGTTVGWNWAEVVHPDDQPGASAAWASATAAGTPFEAELQLLGATGTYQPFLVQAVPLFGPNGSAEWWAMTCTKKPASEREAERATAVLRQTEEKARRYERRYRSLVAALYQMVVVTDPQSRALEIADYGALLDPDSPPTAEGWFVRIHPDDRPQVEASWVEGLVTGQTAEAEYRIRRHDGAWRQVASRMVPVHDEAGRVEEWIAVVDDVTDLRRAEAELRRSERRYRSLVTATAQIVWVALPPGDTAIIHGGEDFGVPDAPVTFGDWLDRVHPNDREKVRASWLESRATEQPFQTEYRLRRSDGKWREVVARAIPVRDESGQVEEWVGVVDDVTEERRLAEQVQQAQKMEAVGRLAGGVAHDFNNLLTVINGYSDLIISELAPDSPNRGLVGVVRDAGERAAGLTQQLLSFSRKQVLEPKVLDLNEVVAHAEKLLRRLIGEDIVLSAVLDPDVPRVKVDPNQIEQVILNLAVNARDAMPGGGRLTIETRSLVVGEDTPGVEPDIPPGHYACLSITDTGHGMTDEVKAQLFEPFFTTKEPGRGTGLGLAVVHGVVKQSGGYIGVYSDVGVGTTFRVLLPAVDAAPARLSLHTVVVPSRGTETILLVEDEETVQRLARVVLEAQGYAVLTAGNGQEAIQVAEHHRGPIHLLLTDVVMPEMGGRELATFLRARVGQLRVLYMSGYTDDAVVRHDILEATEAFLQKPFTPLSLVKKIREVLDAT